ncbi:hypothetical protein [Streptomyces griseofuscus]|uniref:hypothetical protein n=1 Tax=Streptomyces griseofuscus TaxID=146922 RepID=UPI0034513778
MLADGLAHFRRLLDHQIRRLLDTPLTPGECEQGGGTVDRSHTSAAKLPTCKGGKFNGQDVD